MMRTIWAATILVAFVCVPRVATQNGETRSGVPIFEVDPSWPKIPAKWELGEVTSIAIDAQDHAWVLHRPTTVYPHQKGKAAPSVHGVRRQRQFRPGLGRTRRRVRVAGERAWDLR